MTIDGVVDSPGESSLSYWNDQIQDVVMSGMSADAPLFGRVGYQEVTAAWSGRTTEDDAGADFMNEVRRHVVSTTLTSVEWNNSTLLELISSQAFDNGVLSRTGAAKPRSQPDDPSARPSGETATASDEVESTTRDPGHQAAPGNLYFWPRHVHGLSSSPRRGTAPLGEEVAPTESDS
jgi:hypothetical protein